MYVSLFVSERTPKKPKKQWYGRAIVVYLILQTILNLFLLYKGNYIFFFSGLITNVHTFLWNGIKRTFTLMNDKWKKNDYYCYFFFLPSAIVFTVESFSCRSGFEKLIAAHTNLYEEPSKHSLEVLIQNNSQEAKTLRGLVSSLQTQVLLHFWLAPKWKV